MIGKTARRGKNLYGVLRYLFGAGRDNVHVNPRVVAGWRPPDMIQPPVGDNGKHNLGHLDRLMRAPLKLLERPPAKYVYHLVLSAAPEDRILTDAEWERICAEAMARTGLDPTDPDRPGVPWVAVRHDDRHVHVVAVLARTDGTRAHLHNDWYRVNEACRWAERELGLRVIRADRTAARRPTRAEQEKAKRTGLGEPARATLARTVRSAAAAARDEAEFLALLDQAGLAVRLRTAPSGDVTGYAAGLPGDLSAGGGQVWYGGGRLAPDLSLPKLRARWTGAGPGRLTGRAMRGLVARAMLAREVTRAARAARTEAEFLARLDRAGLMTRYRADPGRPARYEVTLPGLMTRYRDDPARPARYEVTLPGLATRAGRPAWHPDIAFGQDLTLGGRRAHWRAGQTGAAPGPELFDGAAREAIYEHAAQAAAEAARAIRQRRPGLGDTAWAAADVLTAAAMATGNPALQQAAEGLQRAAREPWGHVPARTRQGDVLRTAAYLLARCRRNPELTAGLLIALAALAIAVAIARARQHRHQQAAAARAAAAHIPATIPARAGATSAPSLASMTFPARGSCRPQARPDPAARPARQSAVGTRHRPQRRG